MIAMHLLIELNGSFYEAALAVNQNSSAQKAQKVWVKSCLSRSFIRFYTKFIDESRGVEECKDLWKVSSSFPFIF